MDISFVITCEMSYNVAPEYRLGLRHILPQRVSAAKHHIHTTLDAISGVGDLKLRTGFRCRWYILKNISNPNKCVVK
jgi:hypothetical protein